MKKILSFALIALSTAVSAQNVEPRYYAAEFRIVDVRPMCPRSVPGGATCMGLGSVVTVETQIGCVDKLVFNEFQERRNYRNIEIYAVAVVRKDPKSDVIRCVRPNTIRKTLTVGTPGEIKLINQTIEQY